MLIGQASINLSANILSALLGLLSVFVFTRLFSPHDYGIYLLGLGFASVISVFVAGWFRNLILSGHAKDDGTDVRGLVHVGISDLLPRRAGRLRLGPPGRPGRLGGIGRGGRLRSRSRLFELTQDLVRARLKAFTVMKATLVRAACGAVPRRGRCRSTVQRASCCCFRPRLAYLLAVLVQSRTAWRGTVIKPDASGLAGAGPAGPAADAVTDAARRLQRHRSLHDRESRRRRGSRKICRRARPRPADPDDAGDERGHGVLSARRANSCQAGRCGGALASRRMRGAAAQHHAAGLSRLRRHLTACRQRRSRRRFSRGGRADDADRGGRRHLPGPDPAISACELFAVGTQLALSDQHRLDHRSQRHPVLRSDQKPRHRGRGVGPARRRCHRICLRADPQPRCLSRSVSAWAAGADDDRRTGHGACCRHPRQKPACFGFRRVLRPGRHGPRQLRRDVLAARYLHSAHGG